MKTLTAAQKERAKDNRSQFLKLVKDLVNIEKATNPNFESKGAVNPLLVSYYQYETGQTDFRTFKAWKSAGMMVKKGEKGFPIFSRPIGVIKEEKGQEHETGDMSRFGICYLFHAGQIAPIITTGTTNN